MKVLIEHSTRYEYDNPVYLSPHYLRLVPKKSPHVHLKRHELSISPTPSGTSERLDFENNLCIQVWMDQQPASHFSINSLSEVELNSFNPFEFIIDPAIPFVDEKFLYPGDMDSFLSNYTHTSFTGFFLPIITNQKLLTLNEPLQTVTNLIGFIASNFSYERKEKDIEYDAEKIFSANSGSCKELSIMLIEMLRTVGLAARFVSGYAYSSILGEGHELHAWVEVFFPGAGWIGIDPSSGLFTDEHYIPLACSFNPDFTTPVTGSFGGKATSVLKTKVCIQEI